MGLKIGVLGAGRFARAFVPLFKAHPYVDAVYIADLIAERREKYADVFGIKHVFHSFDQLLASDVDAIAIFSQRHLHGEQTLQALRAGKHVYCAVPMAQNLEDIQLIINEVTRSKLIYMSGETSYYYPSTVLCRDRFRAGQFGSFVYGEAQYLHDMTHGFYDAFQYSGGADWKKVAGIPPMFYPTHSVGMILSVTGAKATHVSCLGFIDKHEDGIFREGANLWDNPYSNQSALIRTSDGGMMRVNEFRRVGWSGPNSVYMSMFGTEGSFEEHAGGSVWTTLERGEQQVVTDLLECKDVYVSLDLMREDLHDALVHDFHSKLAKAHHAERLPLTFQGQPNGHFGSHQFLVDDFVKAVHTHKQPPIHAWEAARYVVPGLIAHESSLRDGAMLPIPDFGDIPDSFERLDPESFRA
jgi:predicted dehydrogenase